MSLKVWLPLNGNISNYGLINNFTQSTSPSYTSEGKIGKALTTGALTMSAEQTASVLNNNEVSFCFWVYINADTGRSDNRAMFFGNDSTGENNNRKFSIFNYPTVNDIHLSWQNDSANNTFISCVYSNALPSYQWTHIVVTYRNPTCSLYINGEKKATYTGVSSSSSFAYGTQLLHNATYRRLNDFRIYDHCLSPKEVKELSKALICHFPLSNYMELGISNKYNSSIASGNLSPGNFTKTALSNERGYKYTVSYTGTGSDTWFAISADNFSFTAGKRYYYSCKVRCNSSNFSMQLRASRSNNDWVTNMVTCVDSSLADGKWHEYVVSQVVNSSYDRSGSTVTSNPVLEFYTQSLSSQGTVYSADFDIKDVQVVESDYYLPFRDNVMSTSIVSDTSGFNNNGTKNGNLKWNSNSIRYSSCYDFTGDDYIKIPKPITISNSSYFTISMWVKPQTGCGNYSTILSNFSNPASGFWMAINTEESGTWFYNGTYAKGNALLPIGEWSHIAMVFNAGTITWYTNGVPTSTSTVTSRTTQFTDYLAIGNSYTGTSWNTDYVGSISDVRIYSTVLSSEDIEYLYSMSASLDKQGNLFVYEFKEE